MGFAYTLVQRYTCVHMYANPLLSLSKSQGRSSMGLGMPIYKDPSQCHPKRGTGSQDRPNWLCFHHARRHLDPSMSCHPAYFEGSFGPDKFFFLPATPFFTTKLQLSGPGKLDCHRLSTEENCATFVCAC